MGMVRTIGATTALVAMAVAAVPAEASDRDRRHKRRDRGDKIDAGDVALGAVLLGGLLALTSSKRKPPPPPPVAVEPASIAPIAIEEMTDDDAADACGAAAESHGARLARIAQVQGVSDVERSGARWFASGTLRLRDGYRDMGGRTARFRCSIGSQGVPDIQMEGEATARLWSGL